MRVEAAQFYSDNPPERIMGAEVEYNVQGSTYATDLLAYPVVERALAESANEPPIAFVNKGRLVLQNGGMLYKDLGHIEHCTPESRGPYEVAAGDFAGITIMARLGRAASRDVSIFRRTGTALTSAAPVVNLTGKPRNDFTSGYHENHIIPSTAGAYVASSKILASFLATRLWAWSGMVTPSGYSMSQKVIDIGDAPLNVSQNLRRTSARTKPMATIMLNAQDSDVNADHQWMRVEVRFADAGLSPYGRVLAFGATSLVLRLIEHSDKLPELDQGWGLKDPVAAAHESANDLTLSATHEATNGKHLTAIEYQEHIGLMALMLAEKVELPDAEVASAKMLIVTVDDLRKCDPNQHDFRPVIDRVDWAAKYHVMNQIKGIHDLTSTNPLAAEIDLKWDRIHPEGIGQKWWRRAQQSREVIPAEQVERLVTEPPQGTRANIRGALVKNGQADSANWTRVYNKVGPSIDTFDPYQSELAAEKDLQPKNVPAD